MKNRNILLRSILSCLVIGCLFSVAHATTTQNWWDILNQLKDDWRTDDEIRQAMKDLWYNPNEYLWVQTNPKIKVITSSNTTNNSSNYSYSNWGTTKEWREILNKFRKDWRTDEEIKRTMDDLWIDYSAYFPNTNTNTNYAQYYDSSTYISRSCKPYTIQYIDSLSAYTSPDLKTTEYFVNTDYFKRYVDSKNVRNAECSPNNNRINYSYVDNSTSSERFTAPNGKVYFIIGQNWSFTSNQLSSAKSFATVDELKNYIKKRNPLTNMWIQNTQNQNTQNTIIDSIYTTYQIHSSADNNDTQTNNNEPQTQTTTESSQNETEKEKDSNIISGLLGQLFN